MTFYFILCYRVFLGISADHYKHRTQGPITNIHSLIHTGIQFYRAFFDACPAVNTTDRQCATVPSLMNFTSPIIIAFSAVSFLRLWVLGRPYRSSGHI